MTNYNLICVWFRRSRPHWIPSTKSTSSPHQLLARAHHRSSFETQSYIQSRPYIIHHSQQLISFLTSSLDLTRFSLLSSSSLLSSFLSNWLNHKVEHTEEKKVLHSFRRPPYSKGSDLQIFLASINLDFPPLSGLTASQIRIDQELAVYYFYYNNNSWEKGTREKGQGTREKGKGKGKCAVSNSPLSTKHPLSYPSLFLASPIFSNPL